MPIPHSNRRLKVHACWLYWNGLRICTGLLERQNHGAPFGFVTVLLSCFTCLGHKLFLKLSSILYSFSPNIKVFRQRKCKYGISRVLILLKHFVWIKCALFWRFNIRCNLVWTWLLLVIKTNNNFSLGHLGTTDALNNTVFVSTTELRPCREREYLIVEQ